MSFSHPLLQLISPSVSVSVSDLQTEMRGRSGELHVRVWFDMTIESPINKKTKPQIHWPTQMDHTTKRTPIRI